MRIRTILASQFEPFGELELNFHAPSGETSSEVHLLTGENGTGKTRLLSLMMAACGNSAELAARWPKKVGERAALIIMEDANKAGWTWPSNLFCSPNKHVEPINPGWRNPGSRAYESGNVAQGGLIQSNKEHNIFSVKGSSNVRDHEISAMKPVDLGDKQEHLTFAAHRMEDHIIAQSMTNIKLLAAMDQLQGTSDSRAIRIIQRLESVVSRITGKEFSFRLEPHPKLALYIRWGNIEKLPLALAPDGLRAIIGSLVSCAAKLEAYNPDDPNPLDLPTILFWDEPETHLHPRWQRLLLPSMQALIPNSQIFVATHSPFVISSVNKGWMHLFRTNQQRQVTIESKECSAGDSFLDAVEDVLGVNEWYDPETEELLQEFRSLRKNVLDGKSTDEPSLRELGERISVRSDSLANLIGREFKQLERQLVRKSA